MYAPFIIHMVSKKFYWQVISIDTCKDTESECQMSNSGEGHTFLSTILVKYYCGNCVFLSRLVEVWKCKAKSKHPSDNRSGKSDQSHSTIISAYNLCTCTFISAWIVWWNVQFDLKAVWLCVCIHACVHVIVQKVSILFT